MKQILIINGPNLNLLGTRQPQIYGEIAFDEVVRDLRVKFPEDQIEYLQSNYEGEIIDALQKSTHAGVILNAGGYTHTSVAIRDAISAIEIPVVELHISNISARESFRHESLLSPVCAGVIFGFGVKGYELAMRYFVG
jgi:3-dehydroquinate dehydratase II